MSDKTDTPAELRNKVAEILTTNFAAIPGKERPVEGTANWHIDQIMQLINNELTAQLDRLEGKSELVKVKTWGDNSALLQAIPLTALQAERQKFGGDHA